MHSCIIRSSSQKVKVIGCIAQVVQRSVEAKKTEPKAMETKKVVRESKMHQAAETLVKKETKQVLHRDGESAASFLQGLFK